MNARDLLRVVRRGYAPPPRLTVSAFADREIIVTSGPLAGSHWQTAFTPYLAGIMDAFHEPGVEIVVVRASSQVGKTAAAVCVVAYHMAHDPSPILVVEPTVDPMAKDFAKNRLEPVIDASPALKERVSKKRAKESSNTTLSKSFRGGDIAVGGANSAASLAARSRRVLILDEVDRYPPELPGEGNTIAIAMKRTQAFGRRRRIMMLSSPTLVGAPIDAWFHRGDQRRYHVPCPRCQHMHPLEWKHVRFTERNADTAELVCPACSYGFGDAERLAILQHGAWRPGNPDRPEKRIVSFHLWEAYSPLSSLREIVASFLRARDAQKAGDRSEMHTWENTVLAEPVEPDAGEGVDANRLLLRREPYGSGIEAPDGVCAITVGIDTQDDRLEGLVVGWGPGEESWLLDRWTLPGDTSTAAPWAMLDEALANVYQHARETSLMIHAACIDSAGHRTTMVYDYAARHAARRVFATIGRDGQRPITSSPSPRRWGRGERQVPLYTIGVDTAKALLMGRLQLSEAGPGFVHIPLAEWADEELTLQLTSEVLVTRFEKGARKEFWRKIRPRNEALDCYVMAYAAMKLLNAQLDRWAERLRGLPLRGTAPTPRMAETPGPTSASARPPAPQRRRYSSYLQRNSGGEGW